MKVGTNGKVAVEISPKGPPPAAKGILKGAEGKPNDHAGVAPPGIPAGLTPPGGPAGVQVNVKVGAKGRVGVEVVAEGGKQAAGAKSGPAGAFAGEGAGKGAVG